jgi:hypothetical protein
MGFSVESRSGAAEIDGWAAIEKVHTFGNRAFGVLICVLGIWLAADPVNMQRG